MKIYSSAVEEKLRTLPDSPGVYIMKNEHGDVIYVGKARVLKNRVRQYFGMGAQKSQKTAAMVDQIADFEYIMADSEKEALILECNLIKEYSPHYNILLKDDKHYPYAKIDLKKDFPIIEIVRKVENDGARYFGPYLEAYSIKETLDTVYKLFPMRSCRKEITEGGKKERPCLNYQMGRCMGPCAGKISSADYRKIVDRVIDFLNGKYRDIEKELRTSMEEAASGLEFEKAAVYRDKLALLEKVKVRQKAGFPDLEDRDIVSAELGEKYGAIQTFMIRKGKIIGANRYFIEAPESREALTENYLKQHYDSGTYIPKRIYVNTMSDDVPVIEEWLSELAGRKTEIIIPKRGNFLKLIQMASRNATEALKRKEAAEKRAYDRSIGAAERLGDVLGIGYIKRMECYDISNTQGTDSVSSMVVFTDGKPDKKEYRHFRIKTVEGANDFASMAETLERRLMEGFRAEDREHGFGVMPDLIVIDGGKGQLGSVYDILVSMGLEDINVVGLAKREEEIFVPGREDSIILDKHSPELGLITAIRDEAHRFAITFHRSLREKRIISSELDKIKGVGPKRRKALLDAFRDVDGVSRASIDELASVNGIDVATAREIYRYFNEMPSHDET
jgi:excinuclease ABC subunit C